jgi:uncharacterized OB-fold protein
VDDFCPIGADGKRRHTYDYHEGGCRQVRNVEVTANLGWAIRAPARPWSCGAARGTYMPIRAEYLGMALDLTDLDVENIAYFRFCAAHNYHLQQCESCGLLRYPPTTACPFCAAADSRWTPVEPKGAVHSYTEVHQAIQPAFRPFTPYMVLLVDLDTQNGRPTPQDALRVVGNLVTPDGALAPPDLVRRIGIGSRMRMVFTDVAPGLALPQWTLDETAGQPEQPWRYPEQ